ELVVFGLIEAREVGESRVPAVEQSEKAIALGRDVDVAEIPHLELSRARHLEEIRPFLLDELDPDADRRQAALPHFLVLPAPGIGRRAHREHKRPAIWKVSPAVAVAIDIAELVE